MALEHALLVALRERPAAGLELARRFERSIGFFWQATHQQIYRVLARMEADGWLAVSEVPQPGRPAKKVYAVAEAGERVLADWLVETAPVEPLRSDLAVKLRGAAYAADPEGVREVARQARAEHATRLEHYRRLEARDYPAPGRLAGHALHQYLVLRGGIRLEEFWVDWLTEFLDATSPDATSPDTTSPDTTSPDTTSPDTTSPDATSPGATSPGATPPGATGAGRTAHPHHASPAHRPEGPP